jgi:predicted permease
LTSESIVFSPSLSPPQNLRPPWKFHSSPWAGVMVILILIFLIAIFSYLFVWLIFLKKNYHLIFNLLWIRFYNFSSFGASSLITRVIG